jgi:hypothetical protein
MLWIKASLPIDEPGIQSYISAWSRLLKQTGRSTPVDVQRSLFEHLYDNLNVLDTKTGILISLNGILIASYVFILSPKDTQVWNVDAPAFLLAVAYSTFAIVLCMTVIWVHWSSRTNFEHADEHMHALIKLRTRRTIEFRRAWTFTAISLVALLVLMANRFLLREQLDLTWPAVAIVGLHLLMVYGYDNLVLFAQRRNPSRVPSPVERGARPTRRAGRSSHAP